MNVDCLNMAVKDVLASPKVALSYCYTLAQILCGGRRYPTAAVSTQTLNLLCLAIANHTRDQDVIEHFLSAVRCVLRCCPARVKDILELGVLATVYHLADMHVASASVQVGVCQTLLAFTDTCDFHVWRALRSGPAHQVAARAVSEHMENPDVYYSGNQFLNFQLCPRV